MRAIARACNFFFFFFFNTYFLTIICKNYKKTLKFLMFMINVREIMQEYKYCITDISHFFLITYSKNLIKTSVLH